MRRRLIQLVLPLVLAAIALGQNAPQNRQRLGGTDATQRIQREALHELLMLPYYSVFDNISFRVDGGTVTLLGQVTNSGLKSDSEGVIKKIEGVDRVVNNIEVLPPSPDDDRIRRQTYRAIYGADALFRYSMGAVPPIHIIVNHGHVTLVGYVDNEGDKTLADLKAKGVPGAFSVDNQLQVLSDRHREK